MDVLSWTKKIVIVDVVIVNSVMWAEGWERVKGQKPKVGQLLPDREPGWMGVHHHEQEAVPPSKLGFSHRLLKGFDKIAVYCVNIKYLCVV